jgi:hypothetical protein
MILLIYAAIAVFIALRIGRFLAKDLNARADDWADLAVAATGGVFIGMFWPITLPIMLVALWIRKGILAP